MDDMITEGSPVRLWVNGRYFLYIFARLQWTKTVHSRNYLITLYTTLEKSEMAEQKFMMFVIS